MVDLVSAAAARAPFQGVRADGLVDRVVGQASATDAGKGDGGLTTPEREELARLRRENRKLKEQREILSKARGLVRDGERTSKTLFGFVKANQATHSVGVMCRLLRISRSGFYAWLERPMSDRDRTDLMLTGKIEAITPALPKASMAREHPRGTGGRSWDPGWPQAGGTADARAGFGARLCGATSSDAARFAGSARV